MADTQKREPKRYVVMSDFIPTTVTPLVLISMPDTPRGGVLMRGDYGTLFAYSSAIRAIERTNKYADDKGFDWGSKCRHWLVRVESR